MKWKPIEIFVRGDSPLVDVTFKKDDEITYARFDLGRRNFIDKPPIDLDPEKFIEVILKAKVNHEDEAVIPL